MPLRALHVGLFALLVPTLAFAQGRQTKVRYDDSFNFGSIPLEHTHTEYFQVLTTPAPEDPEGDLLRYWGPKLDDFFQRVCDNLQLTRAEVYHYLLYPRYFVQLEEMVFKGELHRAVFDSLTQLTMDVVEGRRTVPAQPLRVVDPTTEHATLVVPDANDTSARRWEERHAETRNDSVFVWLPIDATRSYQRVVLYRTLHDFLATTIGPPLPEGVLGFVPRHDPNLPVVIYASLGEARLRRTAQHEVAHAVVENIAKYLRRLAPARQKARADSASANRPLVWRRSGGGFSAITHENFAEYLAFPHGEMEPTLRSALIEMVAENKIDGLSAISIGARTISSSYIEGPARLVFLAERFGRDVPKKLLIGYYSNSYGFLDLMEQLTGHKRMALERLYRRWLRELLWGEYLATAVPDTIGSIMTTGLAGVRRDGQTLVQRVRNGRQEIVLLSERDGEPRVDRITRDLDGIGRLPIFSTPDLRQGRVVASVRRRHREGLLVWEPRVGNRVLDLDELGAVREVRDPRWSHDGRSVVFRVVDRSGANAIAVYDLDRAKARLVVPWRWAEVSTPSFTEDDTRVLFISTATRQHNTDVFAVDLASGEIRNVTSTPHISESEPLQINGRLVYISDETSVPYPVEHQLDGSTRTLMTLPFPVARMQRSDSTLTLVATSLRHHRQPAGRAVWEFPLQRLQLDEKLAATPSIARAFDAPALLATAATGSTPTALVTPGATMNAAGASATSADAPATSGAGTGDTAAPMRSMAGDVGTGELIGAPDRRMLPDLRGTDPDQVGLVVSPYKQKWQFMPLGVNFMSSSATSRGASFIGFDTEFHDRSVLFAVGQSGDFDRFGLMQYRNRAARIHWQVSGFHRSMLRTRFQIDSDELVSRNESEQGLALTGQYHKSLVTRLGLSLSLTRRTESRGRLVAREQESTLSQAEAPVMKLQFEGVSPRSWRTAFGGVSDLQMLTSESPLVLERWTNLQRQSTLHAVETEFLPTQEYVRPNMGIGTHFSRDTRVWSDFRGPRNGSLLLFSVSTGFNAGGSRVTLSSTQQDSLTERVSAGLDRVTASMLWVVHRRVSVVDLALRTRAIANDGPQALVYGLGGLHTVAGFPRGLLRSERIAYANLEARLQLWDYARLRHLLGLVFPAGDGFLFYDGGIAYGKSSIHSYGIGLRLRLGMLAYEWRNPFRSGLRNQNGITLTW